MKIVETKSRIVYSGIFTVRKGFIAQEHPDGTFGKPSRRLCFVRGKSVGVLVYLP